MILGWNRILSLAAYLLGIGALWSERGGQLAWLFAMTQAPIVVLIWFADFFGEWIGAPPLPGGMGSKPIDKGRRAGSSRSSAG
jgi:hypothetical protein